MNTDWVEILVVLALGALLLLWVHRRGTTRRGVFGRGIECEVIPRRDATPEELKRLAAALDQWIADHAAPSMTTAYALADLRQGELPQPLSMALEHYLDDSLSRRGVSPPTGAARAARHRQVMERLGSSGSRRAVLLRVRDANHAEASLRAAIPAELVEDILIDQQSWDAE